MDAKDFQLLTALDQNARQSLQALGRKVSLSAPAVRERLHRLEERGILQGFWVSVDPAIFERQNLLVSFGPEWSRDEARNALDAPDVAWVAWKVDGGLTAQVWPKDMEHAVSTVAEFLGRDPIWHGLTHSTWTGTLSGLDWRVLDALLYEPLSSIDRLAVMTGLTPKTVRKHLEGLTRSEAIFVVPRLGSFMDAGEVVYHLLVAGTATFPEVRRVIGDSVLIHETQEPPRKYLFCRAESLGELTEKTHLLAKLPGVRTVQVSLNREMLLGMEFVHRLVRDRIATPGKTR